MRTARRRWLRAGLVALACAGAGWLALAWLLQPERVSALLVERMEAATGLRIALAEPAGLGLLPAPAVRLRGLSARDRASGADVLAVGTLDVSLPWRSLRSTPLTLDHIRAQGIRLDRDALAAWLDRRAGDDLGPPPPLALPELATPLEIVDLSIVARDGLQLSRLDLSTSPLRDGQPFEARLDGHWALDAHAGTLALTLHTRPRASDGALLFDPLRLTLTLDDAETAPWRAEGALRLAPGLRPETRLALDLPDWPAAWPSPWPRGGAEPWRVDLTVPQTAAAPDSLSIALSQGARRIDAQLQLDALLRWLDDPAGAPLPAMQATLDAPDLDLDGLRIDGLRLRLSPDVSGTPTVAPGSDDAP